MMMTMMMMMTVVGLLVAVVRLEAPRLTNILSETTVTIQLFPLTSSPPRDDHVTSSARGGHVTHYYVSVVPANLRTSSNDVRLDEV